MSGLTGGNQKKYDQIYQTRGEYTNFREAKIILDLLKISDLKNKKFVDIGCGGGQLLKIAHELNQTHDYYGCDISGYIIKKAKTNLTQAKFSVQNAEKLSYKSMFFDYVVNLGSLEHFNNPQKAISEMYRILKKGGQGCVYVPNVYYARSIVKAFFSGKAPIYDGTGQEEILLGPGNWIQKLETAGFKLAEVMGFSPYSNNFQKMILGLIPQNYRYGHFILFYK